MSDLGEDFNAMRKASQEKRGRNREASALMLTSCGIKFESKNNGAHLIVEFRDEKIDFWPGTGLWIDRAGMKSDRGVRKLLAYISTVRKRNGG